MPEAYLASVLYDPKTKLADEAVVVVELGPKKVRLYIGLEPTPVGDPSIPNQAVQTLRELGEALRHIQDAPLTTDTLHHFRT
jgi:hypothetical protein